jgi:hypothetical protein
MLLFDNTGKCINAMKLITNKMILKNAYIKMSEVDNRSGADKAISNEISNK